MNTDHLDRTRTRRRHTAVGALLLAVAAVGAAAAVAADDGTVHPTASADARRPSTTGIPTSRLPEAGPTGATRGGRGTVVAHRSPHPPPPAVASTAAEGAVRGEVSAFDTHSAAVVNLDPALLRALREAATEARRDGVEVRVNSGWRSAAYQAQLLREAVAEYGSATEAARWVASPQTSAHVSGDAVDVGPTVAAAWMSRHGAAFGLCQVYRNEPWHYELRAGAQDHGCPALYADPTQDPRMHP